MRRIRDLARSEEGVTLIELMISVSILVIIILPVTASFTLGLLETSSAQERVADSSTAQLVSAYLLEDIQSSKVVSLAHVAPGCRPQVSDDVQLQLDWTDPLTNAAVSVAYFERTSGGQKELYRADCTTTGLVTDMNTTQLALNLDDASGFVASCDPDCANADSVTVNVKAESERPDQSNTSYEPFEFDVTATRRVDS